jgi:lipoate---protein ligase
MLRNSLRKDASCYTSRAVESNSSSVMNLNEKLNIFRDIYEFRSEMMNYFLQNLTDAVIYKFSPSKIEAAESLAETKYKTWEWNYAYGPEYHFARRFELKGKHYSCRLFVKDGIILKCEIAGSDEIAVISKKLIGCRHMVNDFQKIFREENISLSKEEIYYFF